MRSARMRSSSRRTAQPASTRRSPRRRAARPTRFPLIAVTNLARTLRDLKDRGVWILGADAGGENLFDADVSGPVAWVLGAEGGGLRRLTRESCDRLIGIPLYGSVESLNVSVASGICLYATRQARAHVEVTAGTANKKNPVGAMRAHGA
mgnify:CR=1 FL=1